MFPDCPAMAGGSVHVRAKHFQIMMGYNTNESCENDPLSMWPSGGDGTTLCRTEGWTHIKRRAPITVGNLQLVSYQHSGPRVVMGRTVLKGQRRHSSFYIGGSLLILYWGVL